MQNEALPLGEHPQRVMTLICYNTEPTCLKLPSVWCLDFDGMNHRAFRTHVGLSVYCEIPSKRSSSYFKEGITSQLQSLKQFTRALQTSTSSTTDVMFNINFTTLYELVEESVK